MILSFDKLRLSDSPFVERVWSSHSEEGGVFTSIAESRWEMVVMRLQGETTLRIRGPEAYASNIDCPPNGEWLGIRFKLGTFMPRLLASKLVNEGINLSNTSRGSFSLQDSTWQFPDFENADTFVDQLVRKGILIRDPIVEAVFEGKEHQASQRTVRRYLQQPIGLTQATVRQIERARYATILLQEGVAPLTVVHQAGYFDQPHMTRSLKYFIGLTPSQIIGNYRQLSVLYKTQPFR